MDMQEEATLRKLFNDTDLYYPEIGARMGLSAKQVWTRLHHLYSEDEIHARTRRSWSRAKREGTNAMRGIAPEDHPNYSGGVVSDGKGYLMALKPDWYTGRRGCKYVFQHVLVVCEALGLPEIPAGFCVHHIDGDRTNNQLRNLALLTLGAHSRLHSLERATTIPRGSRGPTPPKRTASVA